jgi:hypothetical protein
MTDIKERNLQEARTVAADNLASAVEAIDRQFGVGFAQANPALVAAFMQSCATFDLSLGIAEAGALVASGLASR